MKGFAPTAESHGFSPVPTFCVRDCGRDYGRDVVPHQRNGKERGSVPFIWLNFVADIGETTF